MAQESLLIELFGTSDLQLIEQLLKDANVEIRAKACWALATFKQEISFNFIKSELLSTENDLARIFLTGALYQLDSSSDSPEMLFLSKYFLTHYFDIDNDELKLDLSDVLMRSCQIIGLILWEAGYEYFATNDLATYGVEWLIEKI